MHLIPAPDSHPVTLWLASQQLPLTPAQRHVCRSVGARSQEPGGGGRRGQVLRGNLPLLSMMASKVHRQPANRSQGVETRQSKSYLTKAHLSQGRFLYISPCLAFSPPPCLTNVLKVLHKNLVLSIGENTNYQSLIICICFLTMVFVLYFYRCLGATDMMASMLHD